MIQESRSSRSFFSDAKVVSIGFSQAAAIKFFFKHLERINKSLSYITFRFEKKSATFVIYSNSKTFFFRLKISYRRPVLVDGVEAELDPPLEFTLEITRTVKDFLFLTDSIDFEIDYYLQKDLLVLNQTNIVEQINEDLTLGLDDTDPNMSEIKDPDEIEEGFSKKEYLTENLRIVFRQTSIMKEDFHFEFDEPTNREQSLNLFGNTSTNEDYICEMKSVSKNILSTIFDSLVGSKSSTVKVLIESRRVVLSISDNPIRSTNRVIDISVGEFLQICPIPKEYNFSYDIQNFEILNTLSKKQTNLESSSRLKFNPKGLMTFEIEFSKDRMRIDTYFFPKS